MFLRVLNVSVDQPPVTTELNIYAKQEDEAEAVLGDFPQASPDTMLPMVTKFSKQYGLTSTGWTRLHKTRLL